MAINSTHPDYDAAAPQWSRARDVLAGEDAVKAAGEKYLPKVDSQSQDEYAAYKARASFFGATARTLEEYLDLVFRRAPTLGAGEGKLLAPFIADCDLWGMDFLRYARQVLREVLSVGRAGSLLLWDDQTKRPVLSLWRAEDIINWRLERTGLVELVLRDGNRLRVLKLLEGRCVQELWKRNGPASPEGSGATSDPWLLDETLPLQHQAVPLTSIPFVFHGPSHSRPEPDRLPLADIIAANLGHYRLDADLKHGAHFAALPTAWVSGFGQDAALRIGATEAWTSELPGASAGFLEFSGAGLAYIERAMERVERRMALLGARMLEVAAPEGEASPGRHSDLCGLGNIVASVNQSLSRVLQLAHCWLRNAKDFSEAPGVSLTMNTDLAARALSGETLTAVVAAWRAGAISRESMLEVLKRGELLPEGRTVAQERALIHGLAGGAVG